MRPFRATFSLLLVLAFATLAGASPDAPTFDPTGTWSVVDSPATIEVGTLGNGLIAIRHEGLSEVRGHARFDGRKLVVTFQKSNGLSGRLLTTVATCTETTDTYSLDAVEGTFQGAHEGRPETLRRPIGGNSIELLVDGAEMLPRYLAAIAQARRSVHCECYLWKDDELGNRIGDALIERARAGVKVRAIFDAQGSSGTGKLQDRLKKAGVQVLAYNPVSLKSIGESLGQLWDLIRGKATLHDGPNGKLQQGYDNRDHRKALIVDGRIAFVGGMCNMTPSLTRWHDVHACLTGPAVAQVQRHFVETWEAGGLKITDDPVLLYPRLRSHGDLPVDVVTTVPGVRDDIKQLHLARIASARREVLLETPYFSDDALIAAIKAAAGRGVRVVLILPDDELNDVKVMGAYHGTIRLDLTLAGIEVRTYPRMAHSKVACVDGTWATVGSANLDNRSFERDLEENLSSDDPRFAAAMKARVFDPDVKNSSRWTAASPSMSLLKRALGWVAGAFRDLL